MIQLIRFEFKNMCNQLTFIALAALMIITSTINFVDFFNSTTAMASTGEMVSGIGSYRLIKNNMGNINGIMDQDYLDQLTEEYNKSPERAKLKDEIGFYLTKYTFSNRTVAFARNGKFSTNADIEIGEKVSEKQLYQDFKLSMSEESDKKSKTEMKLVDRRSQK